MSIGHRTARGSALEKYRSLSKTLSDDIKPYAAFKPTPEVKKKYYEEPTESQAPSIATKPSSSMKKARSTVKKHVALEVSELSSVTETESTAMTEATEDESIPSTTATSKVSVLEKTETTVVPQETWYNFRDSEISSNNEADNASITNDVDKKYLDAEWLHMHRKYSYFDRKELFLK